MTRVCYHASHEQHPPSRLLSSVRAAEAAGFQGAMCSDHFHPWSRDQGHSGYAWSWLGAALQATQLSFGTVTAPGYRYHPAVVAQAAATLAEMYPGRFWLALGSGEALNEHVVGARWPSKPERNERLKECADVMRRLFAGETVSHEGRVRVDRAKLYTRPREAPPLYGAALTPATAEWLAGWADGLVTVSMPPGKLREMVSAWRRGGGKGKPMLLQAQVSWDPDEDRAWEAAREQWRMSAFGSAVLATLETPEDFDAATELVKKEDLSPGIQVSSDLDAYVKAVRAYAEMGFGAVYLHHVGRDQEAFIEAFGRKVLPPLKEALRPA